jgi:hypothetical protein
MFVEFGNFFPEFERIFDKTVVYTQFVEIDERRFPLTYLFGFDPNDKNLVHENLLVGDADIIGAFLLVDSCSGKFFPDLENPM